MISGFLHLVWKLISNIVLLMVCAGIVFIGYKANQPMTVAGAPADPADQSAWLALGCGKNRKSISLRMGHDAFVSGAGTNLFT